MKRVQMLAVVGLLVLTAAGQVSAQVAGFSFDLAASGVNDPPNLGDPPSPFVVQSDSGDVLAATFSTQSPSSQFGVLDNDNSPTGDAPMSGNLVFGGRTNFPNDTDSVGVAALQIKFSSMLTGISFDFLTGSEDADTNGVLQDLIVDLGPNGTVVLTPSALPNSASGFYYQGSWAGLSGLIPFDTVLLSVDPGDLFYGEFGIDNLGVVLAPRTPAVPEPGVLAMVVGLAGPLALVLRRRTA